MAIWLCATVVVLYSSGVALSKWNNSSVVHSWINSTSTRDSQGSLDSIMFVILLLAVDGIRKKEPWGLGVYFTVKYRQTYTCIPTYMAPKHQPNTKYSYYMSMTLYNHQSSKIHSQYAPQSTVSCGEADGEPTTEKAQ